MIVIRLAPAVQGDLERIFEHLEASSDVDPAGKIEEIVGALEVLRQHPRIGRQIRERMRELVIGRVSPGHVALYEYRPLDQVAVIISIRAQREAGDAH